LETRELLSSTKHPLPQRHKGVVKEKQMETVMNVGLDGQEQMMTCD